jgi:hypothetical protein
MKDIAKLPKWAQEHIENLQRERDGAIRALKKWTDSQTPSPIFVDEYANGKRYVQSTKLSVEWRGVWLELLLPDAHDPSRDQGINLNWGVGVGLGERLSIAHAAFIPRGFQSACILSPENMTRR